MTSKIVVNNIEADAGISTVTFGSEISASTFNGNIVGTSATFSGNVNVAGVLTYEDVTSVDAVGLSTFQNGIHVTGGSVGIGTDNPSAKVDSRATSNQYVATDDATGDTLYTSVTGGEVTFNSFANRPFVFKQYATERLRINSSGNVGIGTDNPGDEVDIRSDGATYVNIQRTTSGSEGKIQIGANNGYNNITSRDGGSGNMPLTFNIGTTERLRITSDGDIRGSLLESGSGVSVYPEFYRRITGFTGGNSVVNYILLCTSSQPNVRLSGRLVTSRSPGTSACAAQLFDITFQTNHDGSHQSGAIMGLHSGSDGYGHTEAEIVTLTYNSTNYFAIRFSGSTGAGWTTDFDSCYFDGIASDNVLFTHIDSTNDTITNVSVLTADTYKGDVTIQQADLRISDGNIIMASGHGIDFSATGEGSGTMSSELLDDYEEGTWTPTLTQTGGFTLGNGTLEGTYTKVGRLVYITLRFEMGSTTSLGTGYVHTISGLPYTIQTNTNTFLVTASNASNNWIGWSNNYASNTSSLNYFQFVRSGNVQDGMYNTSPFTWTTGDDLRMSGSYFTAQ